MSSSDRFPLNPTGEIYHVLKQKGMSRKNWSPPLGFCFVSFFSAISTQVLCGSLFKRVFTTIGPQKMPGGGRVLFGCPQKQIAENWALENTSSWLLKMSGGGGAGKYCLFGSRLAAAWGDLF